MVKSASKYCSYESLKWIQDNNYIGKQGFEYCKEEVDDELFKKMSIRDEKIVQELLKRWE